jgi:Domain of unknown function (DUF6438)
MRWVWGLVALSAGACSSSTPELTVELVLGTTLTLERTLCFGSCPAYSVRIQGDGAVTYQGTHYVRLHGAATRQIPFSDTQRLVMEFEQANYWRLTVPESCGQSIFTDAPTSITSMTRGEMSHTVSDYRGNPCAPAVLRTLEMRIDEVADTAAWVNCETPDGYCLEE